MVAGIMPVREERRKRERERERKMDGSEWYYRYRMVLCTIAFPQTVALGNIPL